MGKKLAWHGTRRQESRIAVAEPLNYELPCTGAGNEENYSIAGTGPFTPSILGFQVCLDCTLRLFTRQGVQRDDFQDLLWPNG